MRGCKSDGWDFGGQFVLPWEVRKPSRVSAAFWLAAGEGAWGVDVVPEPHPASLSASPVRLLGSAPTPLSRYHIIVLNQIS